MVFFLKELKKKRKIGITIRELQLFLNIFSVSRPVKTHNTYTFIFGKDALGEFLCSTVVLMTAKTMAEDDQTADRVTIRAVKPAADIMAFPVDFKIRCHYPSGSKKVIADAFLFTQFTTAEDRSQEGVERSSAWQRVEKSGHICCIT